MSCPLHLKHKQEHFNIALKETPPSEPPFNNWDTPKVVQHKSPMKITPPMEPPSTQWYPKNQSLMACVYDG